jgi:hypothetical protein
LLYYLLITLIHLFLEVTSNNPRWRTGDCLPDVQGRREIQIKYPPQTNRLEEDITVPFNIKTGSKKMSLNTSHKQYTTDETKLLRQLVIVL